MSFTNIPQEIKRLNQWVAWKPEAKGNGKVDKIPIDVKTGKLASSTDPKTWDRFDKALAYYEAHKNNGIRGIGLALHDDDDFCGIDLDNCRDKDTGTIEDWAMEIIRALNSYTEVSPSGTGIHIFLTGKIPGQRRRNGKVEIYESKRFLTVTGERIGSIRN